MRDKVLEILGNSMRSIMQLSKIHETSCDDSVYFGEFCRSLKDSRTPLGSELGLGMMLFALVVSTRAEKVIEIGRFKGFSTLAITSGLRFIEWGWEECHEALQRPEIDYEDLHRPRQRMLYSIDVNETVHARQVIDKNNLADYVEFINANSRTVDLNVSADILFIDGDHSYEGCRSDVDRFVPHNLRPGGYFILHDYYGYYDKDGKNCSPVKTVCDQLIKEGTYEHILVDTHYMSFMMFRKS